MRAACRYLVVPVSTAVVPKNVASRSSCASGRTTNKTCGDDYQFLLVVERDLDEGLTLVIPPIVMVVPRLDYYSVQQNGILQ